MGDNVIVEEQSSSPAANETCRKNKRKCSSELTVDLLPEPSPVSLTEFPRYEILEQQFRDAFQQFRPIIEKSKDVIEDREVGEEDKPDPEWDDPITCQLEELLSNTLSTNFSDAVKKLVEIGYTEKISEWAVISSSMFNGNKDTVSNIVDGALALLKTEEHFEMPKSSVFEGLQSLVEYSLLEMIHIVREVRPALTVTEAMWCLFISDLNLVSACGLKRGPEASGESPGPAPSEPKSEASGTGQTDSNSSVNLKPGDPRAQIFPGPAQNKRPATDEMGKESSLSVDELKLRFSGIHMDEKLGDASSKKLPSTIFKRDMLRQKAIHFEKNYKGRLTKGSFKAKVAAWGSMMLDHSLKAQSGSSSIVIKGNNSSKLTIYSEGSQKDSMATSQSSPKTEIEVPDSSIRPVDYYAEIPFDEITQKHVPRDEKDQTILTLVPLKAELEREREGWTDWANEKVMQAARKLGKDQAELKALRLEREEFEKSEKEKQTTEERNIKRLSEMERMLCNATGQIELTNCTIKRLQDENDAVKKDLEDAKRVALRSGVKLQEDLAKEQEMMKKLQSGEVERGLMTEKVTNLRREMAEFESRLGKAKNRHSQFKLLLKHEENEKLKVEKRYDSLRAKREEEDALIEVEADKIKQTAQIEKQKLEDGIKNLQNTISESKLESQKKKIAALNVGYGSNVSTGKHQKLPKRLAVFQEIYNSDYVRPDRECVMCMTEEKRVVFIPCGHQVLCGPCNVIHEKQGVNDCPSCRSTIGQRISVIFRDD